MDVIEQAIAHARRRFPASPTPPGPARHEGLSQLSVWRQTMAPGAATPPHSHDCDEVVLCMAGSGELHIDGRVQRFGANETLILPRGSQHQLFNIGAVPMQTLGVFGASPVQTFLPDGALLPLPWAT